MKRTPIRRKGKSITSKLQAKCDKLLTPIVKLQSEMCEAGCGNPTQVGHHWIEKSRSARLRYEIENIIPLCNSCHTKIHNRFGNNIVGGIDIAEVIIEKRGREWFDRMNKLQSEIIKTNKAYYEGQLEKLENILEHRKG